MESFVQFICVFCGSLSDEYGCPCSTRELYGNDAHYGYDCPSQVPFDYNQDPCFNQNLDNFPQTSPSFPRQYLCCENYGGPHAIFQCQPMNQNLYNSSGLDQFQPPQYSVVHQPPQETSEEMLQARETLMESIQAFLKKYDHIPPREKSMALLLAEERFLKVKQAFEEEQNQPEIIQELLLQLIQDLQLLDEILPKQEEEKGTNKQVQKKQEEKSIAELLAEEQAATINSLYQNPNLLQSFIYQDDDNDDDDYDEDSIISMNADMSETPSPDAITTSSPIEEHKDSLIREDEDINTIPEKESDEENESSIENLVHIPSESEATFDNESKCDLPIFDDSPLDVFEDDCVIFSRPLFDSYGDSTSSKNSCDNESVLEEDVFSNRPFKFEVESISSGVNPIYDEGIDEVDFCQEGDIHLIEKLSYDNSSPRPPEELNSEDIIKFFSAFPIPVEDSDFFLEKTKTLPELKTFRFDIEEKKRGSTTIHANISLPEYESFHFDLSDYSLFLADKSDSVSEIDPLSPVLETLLPFSSENEDKVFNPGILVSKEEKSPHLLSHQGFIAFKIIHNFLNEIPMMIYGGDIPIWDDSPDYEDSRARGFVQRSLSLHLFACLLWESYILDLID
ncbi:hypothetical protein Tco_1168536 [Tanacetum coccineum]